MIVRVKIKDIDNQEFTMLFGTSYKSYLDQIKDFFYSEQVWIKNLAYPTYSIVEIETSKSKWKEWGGLKWCEDKNFQDELNREGCQQGEADNPHPRRYDEIIFKKNYSAENKILNWYKRRYLEREVVPS